MRSHHTQELAQLLHRDRIALPVLALHHRHRVIGVLRIQPDVYPAVRSVQLRPRFVAFLRKQGFHDCLEAPPLDGREDLGTPTDLLDRHRFGVDSAALRIDPVTGRLALRSSLG
ncbi:hypothetical protein D9M68_773830 [compost metagenome]